MDPPGILHVQRHIARKRRPCATGEWLGGATVLRLSHSLVRAAWGYAQAMSHLQKMRNGIHSLLTCFT